MNNETKKVRTIANNRMKIKECCGCSTGMSVSSSVIAKSKSSKKLQYYTYPPGIVLGISVLAYVLFTTYVIIISEITIKT